MKSQGAPAQQVAGGVQHQAGDGGGNVQPMVDEQRCPQHTALGDAGEGVDVAHPHRLDGRAYQRQEAVDRFQTRQQG